MKMAMSQVSPPLRIALVGAIAFMVVWMLFLRPQSAEEVTAPVPPAATADGSVAGDAVAGANLSAAQADAKAEALAGGADATVPGPATGVSAAGTAAVAGSTRAPNPQAVADLPRDVARAVRQNKVIALLVWNSRAPEDRRVRRALRTANTHGDKVLVRTTDVQSISRYAPITRGVEVRQTPALVVVDADLRAESLIGYVARTSIRQALSDALRAGR